MLLLLVILFKYDLCFFQTSKRLFLANYISYFANRSTNWIACDCISEQEEYVFVLVLEAGLFVLLIEIHRAGFVDRKCSKALVRNVFDLRMEIA